MTHSPLDIARVPAVRGHVPIRIQFSSARWNSPLTTRRTEYMPLNNIRFRSLVTCTLLRRNARCLSTCTQLSHCSRKTREPPLKNGGSVVLRLPHVSAIASYLIASRHPNDVVYRCGWVAPRAPIGKKNRCQGPPGAGGTSKLQLFCYECSRMLAARITVPGMLSGHRVTHLA
jgi:hypothetical protein